MDFELTDEQELIREAVREFADAEVAPIAAELDRDHRFPTELLPKLADLNLMGRTTDVVRLPLVPPTATTRNRLERLAGELGLLKFAPLPEGYMGLF